MSLCSSITSDSTDDRSRIYTMNYTHQIGLSPTSLSITEVLSPRSPRSNMASPLIAQSTTITEDVVRIERNIGQYRVTDPFVQVQGLERRNALAPSPQVSLTCLSVDPCTINTHQNNLSHHTVTNFQYMAPATDAARINKFLTKKLSTIQQRRRASSPRISPYIKDSLKEIKPAKAEFVSTTLNAVIPSTTRLEREYLFPRATSCISYSDERIRMRLANKANDDRSTKPIMYANYDDVGMRSSSALAILNPFKLAPESLLHPRDELALQPLKKVIRKNSNVKKHLFRSYITAAAANLRPAVSEQGFYAGDRQICGKTSSADQLAVHDTCACSTIIYPDQDISQDSIESLQKKNEELLYRLKYSNFILKIINTDDDFSNEVKENMDYLLQNTLSTKSPKPLDSHIENKSSEMAIKRITDDGIKYTVTYDSDLTAPIIIKIIASHSMLELLYATYKDKRDLIRIIRDYEEDQVAFRMGLLQQTTNSSMATIMSPPSALYKHLSPRSQKISSIDISTKSVPENYSRACFSLINTYNTNNLEYESILNSKISEKQDTDINAHIRRLNYELKRLEEKRRSRNGEKEAKEPQSYLLSDLGLSSFSSTLEISPDKTGSSITWTSPSMTTLISQRPVCTPILKDRLTDMSTHTMALSLLDTFTTRKDICKTVLLRQSQRAPDDLLARASQLREKLAEKRDIDAFNAQQQQKTSMNVHKSNKEVISYMLSSHHDCRKIFATEDLEPTIDKVGRQVVARDYFHGDAPDGAQTATLDTDAIKKTLNAYMREDKRTKKQSTTGQIGTTVTEYTSRYTATRAALNRPKDIPLPRSLNFKTNLITQPAGPWKSMKVTKPDYYPK